MRLGELRYRPYVYKSEGTLDMAPKKTRTLYRDQESIASLKTLLQSSLSAQKNIQNEMREQLKLIRKVFSNISQITSGQSQAFDVLMLRLVNELHTTSKVNELNKTAKSLAKFAGDPEHRLSVRLREARAKIQRGFRSMPNLNHLPELQRQVYHMVEQAEHPMTLQQLLDLLLHQVFALTEYAFRQGIQLEQSSSQNDQLIAKSEVPFEQLITEVSEHLRGILQEMIEQGDTSSSLIGEETRDSQQQLLSQLEEEPELFSLMNMIIPSVNLRHVSLRVLAEHLSTLLSSLNSELEASGELTDLIKLGLQEIDNIVLEEQQHHVIQMRVSSKVVELLELMNNYQSEAGNLTQQALSNLTEMRKQVAEAKLTTDVTSQEAAPPHVQTESAQHLPENRTRFEQQIAELVEKNHQANRPLSLSICSIDNLQEISSQHGQQLATALMQKVSKVLLSRLRDADAVHNIAPGRFALILPGVILQGAPSVMARLQSYLQHLPILYREDKVELKVSFGAASLRMQETANSLIERAEQALNYAIESDGQQISVSHPNGVYTRCLKDNGEFCLNCKAKQANADTSKGLYCGVLGPCSFSPNLKAPQLQAIKLDLRA